MTNKLMQPDGHLASSYELQICDESNKVIAIQALDKAGIQYKTSARKGQFFIQVSDMKTFVIIKRILDQVIDVNKEAAHLGFTPTVTPVGTNKVSKIFEDDEDKDDEDDQGDEEDEHSSSDLKCSKECKAAFKEAGCDEHQLEVWILAWNAAQKKLKINEEIRYSSAEEKFMAKEIRQFIKEFTPRVGKTLSISDLVDIVTIVYRSAWHNSF